MNCRLRASGRQQNFKLPLLYVCTSFVNLLQVSDVSTFIIRTDRRMLLSIIAAWFVLLFQICWLVHHISTKVLKEKIFFSIMGSMSVSICYNISVENIIFVHRSNYLLPSILHPQYMVSQDILNLSYMGQS